MKKIIKKLNKNHKNALMTVLGFLIMTMAFQNCAKNGMNTNQDSESSDMVTAFNKMITAADPQAAPDYQFSERCGEVTSNGDLSWKDAGFPSREACITDGNWHVIYENAASGYILQGSMAELEYRMSKGAEFRVSTPDYGGGENCQQIYRSVQGNNVIYCLSTLRFAGEIGNVYHGSVRYGSDGTAFCNDTPRPYQNSCAGFSTSMKWLVRY